MKHFMRLGLCLAILFLPAAAGAQTGRKPVPPATAPNSVCAGCHEQESKLKDSAHAAVACSSCHQKHEEYPHPENTPKPQCSTCHAAVVQDYERSEHAAQIRQGQGSAPECSTCHGDVHEAKRALTIEFHRSVPDTCGMCHVKEAEQYQKSVHGKAVAAGVRDAPVCSDCHGGHRVLKAKDPNSTVFPGSVPDTCGHCHGDLRLARRFGLPADRLNTFQQSFHGLALKSGRQSVADCASCHGYHDILPSSDPASRTHPKNLAATCGACHPGAGSRFALGPVHEVQGARAPAPVRWVEWFYSLLIPGTIGFMLLHHAGDFIRKLWSMRFRGKHVPMQLLRRVEPHHERMYRMERIQHGLLAASFIVLVYTGFALHYPDAWWASWFLRWEDKLPLRGTVHRIAGVVLIGTSILHLATLVFHRGLREHWKEMLPRARDARELVEGTLWRLGLLRQRPHRSPHSYIEKMEYWAVVWGTGVMAITGLLLWFHNWSLTVMPKVVLDVSRVIHFYEAVLAALSILVWHFYMVIFDPAVYPLDTAFLKGYSPRAEYVDAGEADQQD
jgi:formate dehydrogenase gamma subunit